MASSTTAAVASAPAVGEGRARNALAWLTAERLTVLAVALYGILYFTLLKYALNQDGWLALISGRQIAEHGLPTADTLVVFSSGVRWVDQQWLAQLTIYGVQQLGGLKALALFNVALALLGVSIAVATARRSGASPLAVVAVALPAFVPASFVAQQIRTQIFGVVLFALVVSLLVRDARSPSARVWLVLPLVALWSNLHGSVIVGAGLIMLRGLTIAVPALRPHERERGMRVARGLGLIAGAGAGLFASPNAPHMLEYYRQTAFNPVFGKLVSEWLPATPDISTAAFYALAFLCAWAIGRRRDALTTFEWLALIATGLSAMTTVRSAGWFAMTALMTLPVALTASFSRPTRNPGTPHALIAVVPLAIVAVLAVGALARPQAWFEQHYPPALNRAVERAVAAEPRVRVFADVSYADWLLWHQPNLAGRLAYNTRYELLTPRQLQAISRFNNQVGDDWKAITRGYGVLVLNRRLDRVPDGRREAYLQFLKAPTSRLVYLDKDTAVIRASVPATMRSWR